MKQLAIIIDRLTFKFGDQFLFQELSLQIPQRQLTVIIGSNGAGKSTFLKLLVGVHRPNSGEIHFFPQQHKHRMVYLSQDIVAQYQRFPTSVAEIVRNHLRYYQEMDCFDELLAMFELQEHTNHLLRELSGGQVQRVALLLAFIKKPDLIILDEPTSGIDPDFSRWLFAKLRELSKDISILLTTHNVLLCQEFADHILCLQDGQMVQLSAETVRKELEHRHEHRNFPHASI